MDMSGFQMVEKRSSAKWYIFQIQFKDWTICLVFEWSALSCDQTSIEHFIYKHNFYFYKKENTVKMAGGDINGVCLFLLN